MQTKPNWLIALFMFLSACVFSSDLVSQDWPQWLGENRDSMWNETGIVDSFPEDGPQLLWRAEIAGGYAGPAVANGMVYVADYVRAEGDARPNPGKRSELKVEERFNCFDAESGEQVWQHKYPCNYNFILYTQVSISFISI